jgi:amidase
MLYSINCLHPEFGMISFAEYDQLDGIGLARLIRTGQLSRAEVLATCLERAAAVNPALNLITHFMAESAAQQAQLPLGLGPLAGVPILLKDLMADVPGYPTSNGSRLFAGQIATEDSELVRRYRQAGLIFAAKTTTPEFGLLPYTESELFGATRNPWDLSRTPGGSSGGAAAAVAAGIAPIAHGSDGGGSIRMPASNCGVFGLKPSRGRSTFGPVFSEIWHGLGEHHAITRSVRDSAAMLDIMIAGYDPADANHCPAPAQSFLSGLRVDGPRLRIAFTDQPLTGGTLHPDCHAGLMHSVKLLQQLGHHVEQAHPPLGEPDQMCRAMLMFLCSSMAGMMRNSMQLLGRVPHWREIEIDSLVLARYGELQSAGELCQAREFMLWQGRMMDQFHKKYDVLLTPVINQLPAKIGSLLSTPMEKRLSRWFIGSLGWNWTLKTNPLVDRKSRDLLEYMGWTVPFNLSGQPAASVPLYWNAQNLPIGSQLVGRYGEEQTLLNLAAELEQAQPWAQRRPPPLEQGKSASF